MGRIHHHPKEKIMEQTTYMHFDKESSTYARQDGFKVYVNTGGEPDELSILIATVALYPERAHAAYIELLKAKVDPALVGYAGF